MSTDKVICTIDNDVIFRQPRGMEGLAPCSREEADSRVMVHLANAANKYYYNLYSGHQCGCVCCERVWRSDVITKWTVGGFWYGQSLQTNALIKGSETLCGVMPLPPGACTLCRVLLRCGCTKGSHVNGKCMKAALTCLVLYYVLANTPMESNGQGRGAWSSLVEMC